MNSELVPPLKRKDGSILGGLKPALDSSQRLILELYFSSLLEIKSLAVVERDALGMWASSNLR